MSVFAVGNLAQAVDPQETRARELIIRLAHRGDIEDLDLLRKATRSSFDQRVNATLKNNEIIREVAQFNEAEEMGAMALAHASSLLLEEGTLNENEQRRVFRMALVASLFVYIKDASLLGSNFLGEAVQKASKSTFETVRRDAQRASEYFQYCENSI